MKLSFSKKRVDLIVQLFNCLMNVSEEEEEPDEDAVPFKLHYFLRLSLRYVYTARLTFNQVLCVIHEEPPGLPKAALQMSLTGLEAIITSQERYTIDASLAEKLRLILNVDSIVITTVIGDRQVFILTKLPKS